MREFEFSPHVDYYQGMLEVEKIGNCAIEAQKPLINGGVAYYYLVIRTSLGQSQIFEYGPVIPDIDLFPDEVICSFKRIEYSDYKVEKIIDKFLNNPKRNIKYACTIDAEEALSKCKSIINYMKDFNEISRY